MFNKLRKILVKDDGIKIPEYQQIFNNVIGYDDIKLLLYKMITSKYTNSVLLTGPPASSKTIFILELLDHFKDKAYFVDGTTASGMGIIDYLFDHTDLKFLLIDEIDKLSKKDQKVLLNVMETGILSDVKAKRSKSARQTTCIYQSTLPAMIPPIYLLHYSHDSSNLSLPEYRSRNFHRNLSSKL